MKEGCGQFLKGADSCRQRIILTRINDTVEAHLPREQAGFRKGRSTTDQIACLVNDIEAAFQRKEKFGVVYIDLTAAYDTVWHLYLKLLQTIPDMKLVKFIMLMLQNRSFYVVTSSGARSRKRQFRVEQKWQGEWRSSHTTLHTFIESPSTEPSGHHLSHKAWTRLNHLRTGWGRTRSFLKMVGACENDLCECGAPQTIPHLLQECPIFMPPNGIDGLLALAHATIKELEDADIPV